MPKPITINHEELALIARHMEVVADLLDESTIFARSGIYLQDAIPHANAQVASDMLRSKAADIRERHLNKSPLRRFLDTFPLNY